MMLINYIELEKKDIISIVGAGGKTTMMLKLAQELRPNNKVLVTTTTKIYTPNQDEYDFICTTKEDFLKYCNMSDNGIYVLGLGVNKDNKILGIGISELDALTPYFDYILIEADGAKEKQLKGWNEFEPVIYRKTTKTVGIIDISSCGSIINEDNVHRSEIFCEITGAIEGGTVKLEHLVEIIINPLGLFKRSKGKNILYINKVEGAGYLILAKSLITGVNLRDKELIDKILIGSLKNDVYFNDIS